eukprot:1157553-Pelagomonas_calceolata.AAC.2
MPMQLEDRTDRKGCVHGQEGLVGFYFLKCHEAKLGQVSEITGVIWDGQIFWHRSQKMDSPMDIGKKVRRNKVIHVRQLI